MEKPKKSFLQAYEENPLARAFLGMALLIGSFVCIALIMSENVRYEKRIKPKKQEVIQQHECSHCKSNQ